MKHNSECIRLLRSTLVSKDVKWEMTFVRTVDGEMYSVGSTRYNLCNKMLLSQMITVVGKKVFYRTLKLGSSWHIL